MDFPMPDVKILPCLVCGKDVKVNASYPIREVTCQGLLRYKQAEN